MTVRRTPALLIVVALLLIVTTLAAYAAITNVQVTFSNPTQNDAAWVATFNVTTDGTGQSVCVGVSTGTPAASTPCAQNSTTSYTCTVSGLSASTPYNYTVAEWPRAGCRGLRAVDTETGSFTISPLAVNLARFTAIREGAIVRVLWETVSETDNAGFNVYRSATATSERALLAFIPSQAPGSASGATYEFADDTAIDLNAVYWLEDIDLSGKATLHGPLGAGQNAPNAVSARSFSASPLTPNVPLYAGALVLLAAGLWTTVYRMGRRL